MTRGQRTGLVWLCTMVAFALLAGVGGLLELDSLAVAQAGADAANEAQASGAKDKKTTPVRRAPRPPRPPRGPDQDGDGHDSRASGGDDCDDNDVNRFPGNTEVCDAEHHDEDCNPGTYGVRDADRDGYPDARCCNRSRDRYSCGTDCDDSNAAIHPDAQVCSRSTRSVLVCAPEAGRETFASSEGPPWKRVTCPEGGRCLSQPNGTGICVP